jgi:nicotinamide-nucleotide amidase
MTRCQVGILITGNEILSFKTKDTNGPFLGMHLRRLGIPVRASMVCGDDEKDILNSLSFLSQHCDVILMTGGLGPTSDDLTAELVAKFFGLKTEFFEKAWESCLEAYKKFNRIHIPESNKKQAFLPQGSAILANEVGTAVGFKTQGEKLGKMVSIYCMPGVPFEMEPMFLKEVYPELSSQTFPPVTKTWQVFLMGESAMQSAIESAEKQLLKTYPSSAISYQAHAGFVTYTITLFPNNDQENTQCQKYLLDIYSSQVQEAFGEHVMYSDDISLNQFVVNALKNSGTKLSFFEGSCGGALSKEISVARFAENVMLTSSCFAKSHWKSKEDFFSDFDHHLNAHSVPVCFGEWGAPSQEMVCADNPYGHYFLMFSIDKSIIKDLPLLEHLASLFSWTLRQTSADRVCYVREFQVSPRFAKAFQQHRVALQALCSLAYVMRAL